MCLFPTIRKNPKYGVTKKNKGNVPHLNDIRVGHVPIGCSWCMECMKKKANEWKVRLREDIKDYKNGSMVTLTISEENFMKLAEDVEGRPSGYALDNAVAKLAVRRYLERWRKKTGKSVRHWLTTELGQNGLEKIHLHGIIYSRNFDMIEERWGYGWVHKGRMKNGERINYVNSKTINYLTKYITKPDKKHKSYKPIMLNSKGIGIGYLKRHNATLNKFNGKETKDYYITEEGIKLPLPIYYRNKLYTEEEREKLWLYKLDENTRYVGGEKIKADDDEHYYGLLKFYRKKNLKLGYGSPENWKVREYETMRRNIIYETRKKRLKEMKEQGQRRKSAYNKGSIKKSTPPTEEK